MKFDVAIIGCGPAGQKIAQDIYKLGLKVVVFEKSKMGGTCLNLGCIPTKSILHNSFSKTFDEAISVEENIVGKFNTAIEKDFISKGIEVVRANAILSEGAKSILADGKEYFADKIIIATGSVPSELKNLPFGDDFVISSDDIFKLNELPIDILIVGSGAIGLEWAFIFSNFGVNVNMVEIAENLLPNADIDVSKRLERILKSKKINFFKNTSITSYSKDGVVLSNGKTLNPQKILVAAGRKKLLPNILNSEIKVNDDFTTNFDNVYAIGDVTKYPMLAHSASYQAKLLFDKLFKGKNEKFDINLIPSVIYIKPEVASIGLREQDIKDDKNFKVFNFPMTRLSKAWCDNEIQGFIKIIAKGDLIYGAHIISNEASSLIPFFSLAIKKQINIEELKDVIYPHPSYSEAILEALENDQTP